MDKNIKAQFDIPKKWMDEISKLAVDKELSKKDYLSAVIKEHLVSLDKLKQ